MKKIKIYSLICLLIIAVLFTTALIVLFIKKPKSTQNCINENFYPYYFSTITDEKILNKYFVNRSIYFNNDNIFLIGNNKKELENGYYDIKFQIDENNMIIYINKLQKEGIKFKTISEEYLLELSEFIREILNYKNIDELIDCIREEYINLRGDIQCIENQEYIRKVSIGNYNVVFNIKNNMLELNIKI